MIAAIYARETRFRGEMRCHGREAIGRSSRACLREFEVEISIAYDAGKEGA